MLLKIEKILKEKICDQTVVVKGWIRSIRKSKNFSFIVLNDGTTINNLQIVLDPKITNYEKVTSLLMGAAISAEGRLVRSEGKGQSIEMQAEKIEIFGEVDDTYPLQKKGTSLEFLREIAHLRARTNTFGAVFRIRNALAFATHTFFQKEGLMYVNTPIITGQDAEGAGEMFHVTNFDLKNIPLIESGENKGHVDFSKDYFATETNLTVSGQLEAECLAMGLNAVYTFGPTFRSENSNTSRHLSEFWMIEPEIAFCDLEGVADLATRYLKFMINYTLENCMDDLAFLNERYVEKKDQIEVLKHVANSDFVKITYTEAVKILEESNHKFDYLPKWGSDLQSEHERYLTEVHFKGPVIVTDYPKTCKAFYMKLNPDNKTVRAMDILVPGVGEIIGGSQREENYEKLVARMEEMHMDKKGLWWYLDLRRFGTVPHAGFGLGFERAVMYITGMQNVRDVVPFPRTPKNAEF